jgi:hypothetical protein
MQLEEEVVLRLLAIASEISDCFRFLRVIRWLGLTPRQRMEPLNRQRLL